MSYLKSFIIGSSFPSFILFLIAVDQEEKKTYTYNFYSKILPISIGLGNVLSRFIGEKLNWSLEKRLFYTTIIGVFYRIFTSKKMNYYKYNRVEWCKYNIIILLLYSFTFMIVIYNLERLL